nr:VanW family protein [Desulfitibacter alkalitolerans]
MKPKMRSYMRLYLGKMCYTFIRYLSWYINKVKYAKTRNVKLFPIVVFQHQTPLLRKLKNVEMWLQYNKVKNLKIAVEKVNGIIVYPGETLSYWKLIGKASKRKGYVEGIVLSQGSYRPGVGGGLCQLSNLIYWMTLHTPLTVVERHRHGYDVFPDSNRTQPFGSGATCVYNYIDLQIKNETTEPYQLHLKVTEDFLVGEWRSLEEPLYTYEVYQKEHWITQEHWGGYVRHNSIFRRLYDKDKKLVGDEFITENHAIMMYQPFLQEGANCI